MYEPLRRAALTLLKVPPEPHPPVGDPASLQIFRAGRNYFRLRMATWVVAQALALAGILFWTAVLIEVEHAVRAKKSAPSVPPPGTSTASSVPVQSAAAETASPHSNDRVQNWVKQFSERVGSIPAEAEGIANSTGVSHAFAGFVAFKQILVDIGVQLPASAFPWIWGLKILGFTIYLLQIPITYAVRRLDYEMRWYMVTDRSLRLRHGVWKVSESTMSFANLQQVIVTHGPVQRLLGLGDVKVQSAGGGGQEKPHQPGEDMHVGLFHSVTNAPEIRDLVLDRLRQFRETGLGDPDEATLPQAVEAPPNPNDTLAAAHELLAEARILRAALK